MTVQDTMIMARSNLKIAKQSYREAKITALRQAVDYIKAKSASADKYVTTDFLWENCGLNHSDCGYFLATCFSANHSRWIPADLRNELLRISSTTITVRRQFVQLNSDGTINTDNIITVNTEKTAYYYIRV